MILSVSRRTDIPSFYSDWFFNRISEGFVLTKNPMNPHQISRIELSNDVIDCIVFWTKNPTAMINRLDELKDYSYYFQFTLNAYGKDAEPNIPSKKDCIIPAFVNLSNKIGKDRVIWRYDPIFFSEKYTFDYHVKYFEILASKLCNHTQKCVISFIDYYKNTSSNTKELNIIYISNEQKLLLIKKFSTIAKKYNILLETCAEEIDASSLGVNRASCIDRALIEKISGYTLDVKKDKNQRLNCGCVSSIDIGVYNTCSNGCLYCYANFNKKIVQTNSHKYNPHSAILCTNLINQSIIKEKKLHSNKISQLDLFIP